eukprot:1708168-Amphidinium_carterae.2
MAPLVGGKQHTFKLMQHQEAQPTLCKQTLCMSSMGRQRCKTQRMLDGSAPSAARSALLCTENLAAPRLNSQK